MVDKDEENGQEDKAPTWGRQGVQHNGEGDRVYFSGFQMANHKIPSVLGRKKRMGFAH